MEEWQIRQEIYHRLREDDSDDLNKVEITMTEKVVEEAVDYFRNKKGWIYPSKSYMVAICYSRWLSRYFGDDPYDYLDNPNLLFATDPHFKHYSEDKETYDEIIKNITWFFDETQGMVPDVFEYFKKEFIIDDK